MPIGAILGFVPLPFSYFAFVAIATLVYLALVEIVKTALVKRGAFALRPG